MTVTSPIPGPPSSVLRAITYADPAYGYSAATDQRRATLATTGLPNLPSLMTEVVFMPQFALLDANGTWTGYLSTQGLPGATAPSRWVGATVSGPPVTGTFAVGDFVIDQTGAMWICTVAGSPGTWAHPSGPPSGTAGGDLSGSYPSPTVGSIHLATQSVSSTATLGASSAPVVLTDTTTAAFTLTLPATPTAGTVFVVVDDTGQWNTHTLTIGRNGKNIDGAAANLTLTNQWGKVWLYFDGTAWWSLANGLSNETPGALGSAAAGTHNSGSRADHAHPTTGLITTAAGGTISTGSSSAILTVQNTTSAPAAPGTQLVTATAGDLALGIEVSGDSNERLTSDSSGLLKWGPGSATQDIQLSRQAAGRLTVTSPSSGSAALFVTGAQSGAVVQITNNTSAPSSPGTHLIAAAAADRTLGIKVTGDTNDRLQCDSTGLFQWGSGSTSPDTDLYRSAAATLTTDNSLTVGTNFTLTGIASINGSVFPGCCPPAAATAETFPRIITGGGTGTITSGTLYVTAIMLPKGLAVNNITFVTKGTALTGTLQHGWYVLLDSGYVVRAVTTPDQTSGTWLGATNTHYTLATNAYTTTAAGVYYLGVMAATSGGTGMPTFATPATNPATTDLTTLSPVLGGVSSTLQTTPPATGTTMTTPTANASYLMYAFTS